jgi:hypothetical protein
MLASQFVMLQPGDTNTIESFKEQTASSSVHAHTYSHIYTHAVIRDG